MLTIHLEQLARYIESEGIESINSMDWHTITDPKFIKLNNDFKNAKYVFYNYIIDMLNDNEIQHNLKYGE